MLSCKWACLRLLHVSQVCQFKYKYLIIIAYKKEQSSVHQPARSQSLLCCFVQCCKKTGKSWENHPISFVACNVKGQSAFKCQLFKFPSCWWWNWNLLYQSSQKILQSALDCCFQFNGKSFNRQLLMSADTVGGVKSLFCCCTLDAARQRLTGPRAADAGVNLVRIFDTSHRTDRKDFLNSWQSHSWRPTASRLSAPAVQMACVRNVSYAGHHSQVIAGK